MVWALVFQEPNVRRLKCSRPDCPRVRSQAPPDVGDDLVRPMGVTGLAALARDPVRAPWVQEWLQ